MVGMHQTVGALVVLAFIALTVVNALIASGRAITWRRQLSFGAAGLLLLQYVLGFGLLGSDHKITAWHYLFALAAIVTVGVEHGYAGRRETPTAQARIAAAAAAGTTILVIVAYAIGQSRR